MKIRKFYKNISWNVHITAFIITINSLAAMEIIRNLLLNQIFIFSQTSYSLIHNITLIILYNSDIFAIDI